MGTVPKVAIGTFLGIALAYGVYRGGTDVASRIKRQREDSAIEWMDGITPEALQKACGKPARDVTSDFDADLHESYREMYYRGEHPEISWCFRFTKYEDDTNHLGWMIDSFYRGPAQSALRAISAVNVGGVLDPDENPDLFDTIRPGGMEPGKRGGMIGAMPCLSRIE